MKSGVYKIINNKTGDFYIGSSVNFVKRKSSHFRALLKNKHKNSYLQNSFNKHGIKNFKFEILAKCPKEYCIKLEQWFINTLNPKYNIRKIAESNLGIKASEETIIRMKKALKGKNKGKNVNPIISKCLKTGEEIEFLSTIEAAEYFKCHPTSITRVLTGRRYSNDGYIFRYKNKVSRINAKLLENNNKESLKYLSKLAEEDVIEIKKLLKENKTNREIAKLYNVHEATIGQIKNNKIWKKINI